MNRRASLALVLGLSSIATLAAACSSKVGDSSGDGGSGGAGGAAFHGGGGAGGSTSSSGDGGGIAFGGGDPGNGGGGARGEGGDCGSVALKQTVVPGNIIVVFDQSNSMGKDFADGGGGGSGGNGSGGGATQPKWQAAEGALVASVQPIEDELNLGAIFFPTSSCAVLPITMAPQLGIEAGATFLADFQAHFSDPHWATIGTTPLADALGAADTALPDPSPLKGERAVVVLTDGQPTCSETNDVVVAPVTDMMTRGIKTYAIGLPGSDKASTLLNAIASAGGTGTYISPNSPADLQSELASIASKTFDQCTITLDPAPVDPAKVYLFVKDAADPNGVEVPRSPTDGWTLGADGVTAKLHGDVCTNAKDGDYTDITFVYGCPVLPK